MANRTGHPENHVREKLSNTRRIRHDVRRFQKRLMIVAGGTAGKHFV
jgi:hypothetical protein